MEEVKKLQATGYQNGTGSSKKSRSSGRHRSFATPYEKYTHHKRSTFLNKKNYLVTFFENFKFSVGVNGTKAQSEKLLVRTGESKRLVWAVDYLDILADD